MPDNDSNDNDNMLNISQRVPQAADAYSVRIPTAAPPGWNECVTIVEPSCNNRDSIPCWPFSRLSGSAH